MLLIALLALWLGWKTEKARMQRRVMASLSHADVVTYNFENYFRSDFNSLGFSEMGRELLRINQEQLHPGLRRRCAIWIARHLGPEYAGDIVCVNLRDWPNDDDFKKVRDLRHVEILSAQNYNPEVKKRSRSASKKPLTDAGLANLARFYQLRTLDLGGGSSSIGGDGLAHLANLRRLQTLNLIDTCTSDAGLAHLRNLPELEDLELTGTLVDDDGAVLLSKFPNLRRLGLARTQISDAGLIHLQKLGKLKSLGLTGTKVTPAGVAALKKARPTLSVSYFP